MKDFGQIAEQLRRSTVQVIGAGRSGSGSGIVWDAAGTIVTNAHVATGATSQIELWDGTRLEARTIKRGGRQDLACLQVPASGLPQATFGDSASLRAGELAIAVGNPLGFVGAVSTGVIHAVGPLQRFGRERWVQSTVRLAPGNSGGPLANARGEVIGINTMIVGGRPGANLALAIPSARVVRFVSESGQGGEVGMTVRPVRIEKENALGFLILETQPGLPAQQASLLMGDLIVGVNERRFQTLSDLEEAIAEAPNVLALQFRRGGGRQDRTATLVLKGRRTAAA